MIKKFTYASVLIILSCTSGSKKNVDAVVNTFNEYKTAILAKNGKEAIKYLDKKTLNYYEQMLEHARTINSRELQELSLIDKIMIMALRHRGTSQELNAFDGETMLIWAIENGMIGEESVRGGSIGEVKIDGTVAKAQFISNGQITPFYYEFRKSGDNWKLDLTSIFQGSEQAMQQILRQSDMSEHEFIFYLLELSTGKKVNENIWYKMQE